MRPTLFYIASIGYLQLKYLYHDHQYIAKYFVFCLGLGRKRSVGDISHTVRITIGHLCEREKSDVAVGKQE